MAPFIQTICYIDEGPGKYDWVVLSIRTWVWVQIIFTAKELVKSQNIEWRDSTEVERSLCNLVLDSFAGSRVQTPLEAKRIEKSIQVSRVLVFSFAGKTKARCLLQRATSDMVY